MYTEETTDFSGYTHGASVCILSVLRGSEVFLWWSRLRGSWSYLYVYRATISFSYIYRLFYFALLVEEISSYIGDYVAWMNDCILKPFSNRVSPSRLLVDPSPRFLPISTYPTSPSPLQLPLVAGRERGKERMRQDKYQDYLGVFYFQVFGCLSCKLILSRLRSRDLRIHYCIRDLFYCCARSSGFLFHSNTFLRYTFRAKYC